MKVLIGCEASGVVRRAFRSLGHDAWSCDLRPADDDSQFHRQCDVLTLLDEDWDMMICHPDCTYLTNSAAWAYGDGPYHMKLKPGTLVGQARREAREDALNFVRRLLAAPIKHIALENPIGCISSRIRQPDQIIQPWMFGDDASKATCLWLQGLPCLKPTQKIAPRMVNGRPRWGNQTDGGQNKLPPSEDRWALRSLTYAGVARAMADQWNDP